MRVIPASKKRRRDTWQGLDHDGFERCKRAVNESSELVASSLCRATWEAVGAWLAAARQDDTEAPVRLAVVRAGFCEGNRSVAVRRARRVLKGRVLNVKARRLESEAFFKELQRHRDRVVIVIDDIECVNVAHVMAAVVNSNLAGVVFVTSTHWSVPSSFSTSVASRIMARDFELPPFDVFLDAFLDRLLRHDLPVVVGPRVIDAWLDDAKETRNLRRFLSQVEYFLFVFFYRTPAAFVAVADSLPVAVAEVDRACLKSLKSVPNDVDDLLAVAHNAVWYRKFATCALSLTEASLRFAQAADPERAWHLAVSIFGASTKDAARAMKRALRVADDIVGLLSLWVRTVRSCLPLEPHEFGSKDARRFATRLLQLHQAAVKMPPEDRAKLETNAHTLYVVLANGAAKIKHKPLNELVFFDDADVVAKPFRGRMWSDTIETLASSQADVRCIAFQVVTDNPNLDINRWYALLHERIRNSDLDVDDEDRACQFVRCCVPPALYVSFS